MRLRRVLTLLLPGLLALSAWPSGAAVPEDSIEVGDPTHDVAGSSPNKHTVDVRKVSYRFNIDRDSGQDDGRHLAIEVRFERGLPMRPRSQVVHTWMSVDGTRYLVKFSSVRARMWRLDEGGRHAVSPGRWATIKSRGEYGDWVLRFDPPAFAEQPQVDWFRTEMWLVDADGHRLARDTTDRTSRPLLLEPAG